MQDIISRYEKIGLFYFGKEVNNRTLKTTDDLFLYKSKYFTTHAMIVGMTGSGKTGLGISIIEEASIDKIPSIIIDPKGDMGNLLLAFPEMRAQDFEEWIDQGEAENKGMDVAAYAEIIAGNWKSGLERFHQGKDRIRQYKDHIDFNIYTPGSSAGIPLSVLSSFEVPSENILDDPDAFSSVINSTVMGLLALINVNVDPLTSKEYMLLATIFSYYWTKKKNISLEELIGFIASPPFKKIGVLNLNLFYPQSERLKLAMLLNSVLASPGFSIWKEGEPLDIQRLLYTEEGKPKVSILSISHLNHAQRMFFVTLFLNKYISWMRQQSGTSSLRTLLYMDEIFGFFPATSNPPSKRSMLILLKQARAFGIGIILATQNPVDLDYKGLANIGSWFLGRLQTKQDKERVMDGLIKNRKDALNKREIGNLLSNLEKRTFLLKSAHLDQLILFQTRWVLSFLRGPLSKAEIKRLMERKKAYLSRIEENFKEKSSDGKAEWREQPVSTTSLPLVSDKIKQYFLNHTSYREDILFEPNIILKGTVRIYSESKNIDVKEDIFLKIPISKTDREINFSKGVETDDDMSLYQAKSRENASFSPLPLFVEELKDFKDVEGDYKEFLYRSRRLNLYQCKKLKLLSRQGEDQVSFKVKMIDYLRELKEKRIEQLKEKFEKKEALLQKKYNRLLEKLEKEEQDSKLAARDSVLSLGASVLGAFLGRTKIGNLSSGMTGLRRTSRIFSEKKDVNLAKRRIKELSGDIEALEIEFNDKVEEISEEMDVENYEMKTLSLQPRRTDIYNLSAALLWESRN